MNKINQRQKLNHNKMKTYSILSAHTATNPIVRGDTCMQAEGMQAESMPARRLHSAVMQAYPLTIGFVAVCGLTIE